MAKIKVRRTLREELPGMVVLRDAAAADLRSFPRPGGILDLDMEADPTLQHLVTHDPDGCVTALDRDETLGFAASHVRSRQWILSELWVLPQHRGRGAGDALLSTAIAYGERSGAREFMAVVPTEGPVQALLVAHGFRHLTPVFGFALDRELAEAVGGAAARLHAGADVTGERFKQRGQGEIERLDRLTRNVTRVADHTYWLKQRRLRLAFVKHGDRVTAYGYGGSGQIGPVAGSTQDAALSALGWALQLAVSQRADEPLRVLVPERFRVAVEALVEGGARLEATYGLWGRGLGVPLDRYVFGTLSLP
jgi:ribosomal protein S18 acetylase RimI-like enzyme